MRVKWERGCQVIQLRHKRQRQSGAKIANLWMLFSPKRDIAEMWDKNRGS